MPIIFKFDNSIVLNMTKNICPCITLWIFILITIGMIVGLAMVTKLTFVDPKSHYHEATCQIHNCTSKDDICWGNNNYNYPCYRITANITLNLENVNNSCTKFQNGKVEEHDFCKENMTCYYDDRETCSSLRLFHAYEPNALGVGILATYLGLAVIAWVIFVILFIVSVCKERDEQDNGCNYKL